jgi:hypothetical protein
MHAAINRIKGHGAQEAIQKLRETGIENIPDHLYEARRKAIAHAKEQPIVDPDDAGESEMIRRELPVIAGMAELAIEEVLGIPTRHTEWSNHLYELAGFKDAIGADAIAAILSGSDPEPEETINLPCIDVELRRCPQWQVFRRLCPVHAFHQNGKLQLIYRSEDGLAEIEFILDFREERLRFNWNGGIRLADDGSRKAAEYAAEVTTFLRNYLGNGQLLLFDADTRQQLSRVDAFIPTNFLPNYDTFDAEIMKWESEAVRRASTASA